MFASRRPDPVAEAERQRQSVIRLIRIGFFIVFMVVVVLAGILGIAPGGHVGEIQSGWYLSVGVAFVLAGIAICFDIFVPSKKISTLVSVMLGLLAALIVTIGLAFILDLLVDLYGVEGHKSLVATTKVLMGITLGYVCITTVLQTQDDFRLVIPYVEFAKQVRGPKPLLLDTSALIDGRIVDVAETGILQAPMVIPEFVVNELQVLADSSDKLKRTRGRRGLDVITRLQRSLRLDVSIDQTPVPGKSVDPMLIELAKRLPATIVTTDTGLARVAGIQGVGVLNLNDLAAALKPSVIPGEQVTLTLLRPGEQRGQAVGYLDDGTMVVAEDGYEALGQEVTLTVTSTLQTSAGRLIFGRLVERPGAPAGAAPGATMGSGVADAGPAPTDGRDERGETLSEPRRSAPEAAEASPRPAPPGSPPRFRPGRNPRR
jgi:uncharacterized protein YacL